MADKTQEEKAKEYIQRMKDMGIYQSDEPLPAQAPTNAPTTSPTQAPTPGAGMAKEITTPAQQKILDFKQYLHLNGLYNGDVNSPEADPQFVSAIQNLETLLTNQVRAMSPGSASLQGLIWQGNQINPKTSVEDIQKAIQIIDNFKRNKQGSLKLGQATVDTFDVEEYQENPPMAFKPNPTGDDYKLETGNPFESQQIGKLQAQMPADSQQKDPLSKKNKTMDERVLGLSKLLSLL